MTTDYDIKLPNWLKIGFRAGDISFGKLNALQKMTWAQIYKPSTGIRAQQHTCKLCDDWNGEGDSFPDIISMLVKPTVQEKFQTIERPCLQ